MLNWPDTLREMMLARDSQDMELIRLAAEKMKAFGWECSASTDEDGKITVYMRGMALDNPMQGQIVPLPEWPIKTDD